MAQLLRSHQKTLGIFAFLILVYAVTAFLAPGFSGMGNLFNVLRYIGMYGIIAIGVSFVIISGGIDLSIGSLIGIAGVLLPRLLVLHGWPIPAAMGLILVISLFVGLCHGLLITKLRLQPFLVTLCGLFIYRGLARSIGRDEKWGFGSDFTGLREAMVKGTFLGLPMSFIILLVVGALAAVLLNRTVYGRHLLALGRNEEAARFSGIETDRTKIVAYMICSLLAGLGGMMFVLDNNSATGSAFGSFYELYAIAGAVLGGCSLRGGEGAILGVILGAALVQVIDNAVFFLMDADTLKYTIIGGFILVGVIIDELLNRVAARRRGKA